MKLFRVEYRRGQVAFVWGNSPKHAQQQVVMHHRSPVDINRKQIIVTEAPTHGVIYNSNGGNND